MSIPEVLAGLGMNLAFLSNGLILSYPTILLSQIGNDTNAESISLTQEQGSWIAGIVGIGGIFGSLIFGTIIGQRIGNRKTLMLVSVLNAIGWLLIGFALSAEWIMIGRFFNGVFVGTLGPSGYTFLSEITNPKHRGSVVQSTAVALSTGMLIIYGIGAIVHWPYIAIGCSVPDFIFFIILTLMPDSPYYNALCGKIEQGKKSLQYFRSKKHDVETEFNEILKGIEASTKAKKASFLEAMKLLFKDETCYKPFIILNILFALQSLSGLYMVITYAVQVFKEAGTNIDKYLSAIISGSTRLVFGAIAIPLLFYFPRKTMLYVSTGMACVSITILGVFGLINLSPEVKDLTKWLPILCVSAFMVAFTLGFQSIPFLYLGEYYPPFARQHLAGMTSTLRFLGFFITLKFFPKMIEIFGPHATFCFLGCICLISGIYAKLVLPETKGLTLNEINQKFKSREKKSDIEI